MSYHILDVDEVYSILEALNHINEHGEYKVFHGNHVAWLIDEIKRDLEVIENVNKLCSVRINFNISLQTLKYISDIMKINEMG